jgi:hypothetical protein
MKKILCMLVLIQSGFIMAQSETVVTPNGKKVTIFPAAPGTANNGLTLSNNVIQLGGDLVQPSVLTTTEAFTLAIKGLEVNDRGISKDTDDYLMTVDPTSGVLRTRLDKSWGINGNSNIGPSEFIGTVNDEDLRFRSRNTRGGRIGPNNTIFGYGAYAGNAGTYNSAFGQYTLLSNTGSFNTAIGSQVLAMNKTGERNTGVGSSALYDNTTGIENTAVGYFALGGLTTGSSNVAVGFKAGYFLFGTSNPQVNLTNATKSIFIGVEALTAYENTTNQIVIGYKALGRGSNTVVIGNSDITSIGGYAAWSNYSDSRLKKNIVSSGYGLNFINKLRPVLYNMKTGSTELQTGFIAQEVEAAAKGIGYEFNGVVKPQSDADFYALSYASFVVPLVKAVQEQQSQIESMQKELNDLKAVVQQLINKN